MSSAPSLRESSPPPAAKGGVRCVVVDDDPEQRALLQRWLERAEIQVQAYGSARALAAELDRQLPDVLLLDVHLDGEDGLVALERVRRSQPTLPVVMLTADGTAGPAAAALRLGAFDYLLKPVDRQQLLQTVQRAAATQRVAVERREAGVLQQGGYRGLIGESPVMRRLYRQIERVGASEVTVLVQGESGTGKELVARALHLASPRSAGPFVPINCAAVPETLQESELFGHERGAFTGASARRTGRFEQASGGTLFLDEVAELDLALQAKLLRVLQERSFFRVGGTEQIQVDVRVVAATHKDLRELASEGKFREDLYYRLAVFELDLPALRQRREDLPALVQHFMALLGERHQRPGLRLSEEANQLVQSYAWPGNVRELQNALERAVVGCLGEEIEPEDLPRRLREGHRGPPLADLPPSSNEAGLSPMEELERAAIAEAIRASDGNMSDVIRRLGIPRTTLYRKLRRYGLR